VPAVDSWFESELEQPAIVDIIASTKSPAPPAAVHVVHSDRPDFARPMFHLPSQPEAVYVHGKPVSRAETRSALTGWRYRRIREVVRGKSGPAESQNRMP
jgi:hypothetical protein